LAIVESAKICSGSELARMGFKSQLESIAQAVTTPTKCFLTRVDPLAPTIAAFPLAGLRFGCIALNCSAEQPRSPERNGFNGAECGERVKVGISIRRHNIEAELGRLRENWCSGHARFASIERSL